MGPSSLHFGAQIPHINSINEENRKENCKENESGNLTQLSLVSGHLFGIGIENVLKETSVCLARSARTAWTTIG